MNPHLTGMTGVYFAAAELSRLGFIVSMTVRNSRGPDLLITDQACRNSRSVQVKTNAAKRNSWQLGQEGSIISSPTYLFVFVTLNRENRPDYMIVPSATVAAKMKGKKRPYFNRGDGPGSNEGWDLFEFTALHALTWKGAREIGKEPGHFSTTSLQKAVTLLKPASANKLDREYRKAIVAELASRGKSFSPE